MKYCQEYSRKILDLWFIVKSQNQAFDIVIKSSISNLSSENFRVYFGPF